MDAASVSTAVERAAATAAAASIGTAGCAAGDLGGCDAAGAGAGDGGCAGLLSAALSATPFISSFASNPGGPDFLGVTLLCCAGDTGAGTTFATSSGVAAACGVLGSTWACGDFGGRGEVGGCSVLLAAVVACAAVAGGGGVCIGSRYL